MATTYVQLTREEFEAWLGTLGHRWHLKPGKVGIYVVELSERVAIEVASSMTGRDDVVDRAQASMGVKLVSRITGFTLNKKAQEQSHVKRTINWRDNLRKVYDRMIDAYRRSESFYEALAEIEDRDKYKSSTLAKIEGIPNWQSNNFLSDLHKRVSGDGILTIKQLEALDRAADRTPATQDLSDRLPWLRGLYAVSRAQNDSAVMSLAMATAVKIKNHEPITDAEDRQLRQASNQYRRQIEDWLEHNAEKAHRVANRWMTAGLVLVPENATERYHTRIPREKNTYQFHVKTQPADNGTVQVWMAGPGAFGSVRTVLPPTESRTGDMAWLRSQFWGVVHLMNDLEDTVHKDDVAFQHWTARPLDRLNPRGNGGVEWLVTVPEEVTSSG